MFKVVLRDVRAWWRYWELKWELLDLRSLKSYLLHLAENLRNRIMFTLNIYKSAILVLKIIKRVEVSAEDIVEILEEAKHHC